jgi:putative flippase GtrA
MAASKRTGSSRDELVMPPIRHWARGYFRFLGSGAVVGLICVLIREVIAWLLGSDTRTNYFISVFVVYGIGFALSYIFQARYVFQSSQRNKSSLRRASGFIVVALTGAVVASWLSSTIRYELGFDTLLGQLSPAISLLLAAVIVALPNYSINRLFVFRDSPRT